jgi:hypothetical protein
MHISTIWLALVLIAALAAIAVELGIGGVQVSPLQPSPAQAQSATTHPTMSGDFFWLTVA